MAGAEIAPSRWRRLASARRRFDLSTNNPRIANNGAHAVIAGRTCFHSGNGAGFGGTHGGEFFQHRFRLILWHHHHTIRIADYNIARAHMLPTKGYGRAHHRRAIGSG